MILRGSVFDMVTISSMVFIGVIFLLLHLLMKFPTRKKFFFIEFVISVAACLTMGLYNHLSWLKIIAATTVITTLMIIGYAISVYAFEWINKVIKDSLKNNKSEK